VNPAPLVSEAVRGAGAHLVDWTGQRFTREFDDRAELAPRDVVARAVAYAVSEGGAFLDARELPDFAERFPGIHEMLARHHIDPAQQLVPVAPALHYAMGGILTDLDGRTTVPGLWAIGEVASTGVHGANRLASNSLLEGLVFADRAARALASGALAEPAPMPAGSPVEPGPPDDGSDFREPAPGLREVMRTIMTGMVGLSRTEGSLEQALRDLAALEAEAPAGAWRTRHQLRVAQLIARSALERRESRGGHRRIDFPPADQVRIAPEPLGLD
jgi:aspartate oxidase